MCVCGDLIKDTFVLAYIQSVGTLQQQMRLAKLVDGTGLLDGCCRTSLGRTGPPFNLFIQTGLMCNISSALVDTVILCVPFSGTVPLVMQRHFSPYIVVES